MYKAKLKSGETVAVKVQHRAVRAHSFVDMKTMELMVRVADWVFPDFKLLWLVNEMKINIPQELDFLNEGENAEHLRRFMGDIPWLKVSISQDVLVLLVREVRRIHAVTSVLSGV